MSVLGSGVPSGDHTLGVGHLVPLVRFGRFCSWSGVWSFTRRGCWRGRTSEVVFTATLPRSQAATSPQGQRAGPGEGPRGCPGSGLVVLVHMVVTMGVRDLADLRNQIIKGVLVKKFLSSGTSVRTLKLKPVWPGSTVCPYTL